MSTSQNGVDTVLVNGAVRKLRVKSLPALLSELGHDPAMPGLAVAINDTLVTRGKWSEITLCPGDRIEIVSARQGG